MGFSLHLILKGMIMKIPLLCCVASFVLATTAIAQSPSAPPADQASSPSAAVSTTPTTMVSPSATLTPSATASPARGTSDDLESRIEKKVRKHFNVSVDDEGAGHNSDVPWMAVPIVTIVFLTIFGTPILIVAVIMYFSMSEARAMHRTVRLMVEKGQEVPTALFFSQAEDGIRAGRVTGVQTCALPIFARDLKTLAEVAKADLLTSPADAL